MLRARLDPTTTSEDLPIPWREIEVLEPSLEVQQPTPPSPSLPTHIFQLHSCHPLLFLPQLPLGRAVCDCARRNQQHSAPDVSRPARGRGDASGPPYQGPNHWLQLECQGDLSSAKVMTKFVCALLSDSANQGGGEYDTCCCRSGRGGLQCSAPMKLHQQSWCSTQLAKGSPAKPEHSPSITPILGSASCPASEPQAHREGREVTQQGVEACVPDYAWAYSKVHHPGCILGTCQPPQHTVIVAAHHCATLKQARQCQLQGCDASDRRGIHKDRHPLPHCAASLGEHRAVHICWVSDGDLLGIRTA